MSVCNDPNEAAPCNNSGWAPTTGGGGSTSGGGTTIPWSDPNYWNSWNNTFGSLGSALGSWSDAFDGNNQPYYQPMQGPSSNTYIYIGMGLLFLLLVVIMVFFFRKK